MKKKKAARLKAKAAPPHHHQQPPHAHPTEPPVAPPGVEAWPEAAAKPVETEALPVADEGKSHVVEAIMCLVATLDDAQLAEALGRMEAVAKGQGLLAGKVQEVEKVDQSAQVEALDRPRPAVARHVGLKAGWIGEGVAGERGGALTGNGHIDLGALNSLEGFY